MKRNKEDRILVCVPDSRQEVSFDRESVRGEDQPINTPSTRMLDNLKIALFFCQVQCQMSKDGLAR